MITIAELGVTRSESVRDLPTGGESVDRMAQVTSVSLPIATGGRPYGGHFARPPYNATVSRETWATKQLAYWKLLPRRLESVHVPGHIFASGARWRHLDARCPRVVDVHAMRTRSVSGRQQARWALAVLDGSGAYCLSPRTEQFRARPGTRAAVSRETCVGMTPRPRCAKPIVRFGPCRDDGGATPTSRTTGPSPFTYRRFT